MNRSTNSLISLRALRFQRARRPFIALAGTLFTVAVVAGCGDGGGRPTGPNLLLITIDTLRADRLGSYGHEAIETPAMDRLAAEGVRFARAVAAAPPTLPSHASILTGASPPRHGVRDNAAGVLPETAVTLAEAFKARDYHTAAFVSAFVLDSRWGLSQGFDAYDGPPVAPGEAPSSPQEAERIGEVTLQTALDWIGEERGAPWLVWLHLFDPHAPYAAPEPYRSRYADPYDGEVAYVDALIARLRGRLEELGEWAGTTVVLTSDHGEALREHGEPAHGFFLYEPTLRVPLIVRTADANETSTEAATGTASGPASPGGRVVETPVALIDIYPTIVELFELDAPAQVEGRSLAPALRGEPIDAVPIYSETLLPRLYFGWHELRAITLGTEKFIEAPRRELYDLSEDPGEENNLAEAEPERADTLEDELAAWLERSEAAPIGAINANDADRLAGLRALGYLGVGGASADAADLADPKDRVEVYAALMAAFGAWELGDIELALQIIDGQIDADPDFAGAQHFRGLVLAGVDRFDEAALAFARALDIDPDHPLAGRELARAYRSSARLADAVAVLRDQLLVAPADIDLRWELADLLLRLPDFDAARRVLDEGLSLDPEAAKMHFGKGILAMQQDDGLAALESLDRAAARGEHLPNLNYTRGLLFEGLDRLEEAIAAYAAEIARQPRHYPAHLNRARLLVAAGGSLDEVVEGLSAALAARPDAPEAMLFLAQTLVDRGDPDDLAEAERLATSGLAVVRIPRLAAMGHSTLAQIYEAQGRSEEAKQQQAAADSAARARR